MARRSYQRRPAEATIALINVVFLMLVFFLIAGSLAQPVDPRIRLVSTDDPAFNPPPDALVILASGETFHNEAPVTPEAFIAARIAAGEDAPQVRIAPDRDLPAADLVATARALRAAGAGEVWLVTQRGDE